MLMLFKVDVLLCEGRRVGRGVLGKFNNDFPLQNNGSPVIIFVQCPRTLTRTVLFMN